MCVSMTFYAENWLYLNSNNMILLAVRELDIPGDIYERKTFPFEFSSVEMPYESYNGINVRLRWAYLSLFQIP